MKKFLVTLTAFICLISSGCFQGSSNLTINDDGTVFLKNRFLGVPFIAEQMEQLKKNFEDKSNAEISPVSENNLSGYEVTMNYPDVKSFAADGISLYSTHEGKCKGIRMKDNWFFDVYNFDLLFSNASQFSPTEAAAVQSILSQVAFDMTIALPYVPDSHNADKIDATNKILTWNLAPAMLSGNDKHMRVQFKIWNKSHVVLTLIFGVILFAATMFFFNKVRAEESESIAKDLRLKRNIFAGLLAALLIISIGMLLIPVEFTDADIISAVARD
ncbi:MAG: hypothetical protein K6G55_01050 [Selenomonadaceae bacterium]|nr:hypothetical protein [Selenomonadaceae bacterium]